MTPDVNVLLAAARSDHPHHAVAHHWLSERIAAAESGGSLAVMPMVLAGFLRLVTHPRVFHQPTPPAAAIAFVDSLLSAPGVEFAQMGSEWPALRRLTLEHDLSANDVPDAWLAAAVATLGEHLVTFDRGFERWLGRTQLTVLRPD